MLPELAGAAEAEDFFEALDVAYDPRVLATYRLPLLRRLRAALDALERDRVAAEPAQRREELRATLAEAHALFAAGGPGADALLAASRGAPLVRLGPAPGAPPGAGGDGAVRRV